MKQDSMEDKIEKILGSFEKDMRVNFHIAYGNAIAKIKTLIKRENEMRIKLPTVDGFDVKTELDKLVKEAKDLK